MLNYAESFGLIIFVYALGLQVGRAFSALSAKGGVQLNMLALGVVLLGTLMTVLGSYTLNISVAGHGRASSAALPPIRRRWVRHSRH